MLILRIYFRTFTEVLSTQKNIKIVARSIENVIFLCKELSNIFENIRFIEKVRRNKTLIRNQCPKFPRLRPMIHQPIAQIL